MGYLFMFVWFGHTFFLKQLARLNINSVDNKHICTIYGMMQHRKTC